MRLDDLLPLIPMLEGVKRGETWQIRQTATGGWRDMLITDDVFALPDEWYRKKPEPRSVWLAEYPSGLGNQAYKTKYVAASYAAPDVERIVKFIEVPE